MSDAEHAVKAGRDRPVLEVVLSTLEERLKAVHKRFSQAVRHGDKDAEPVHKLRVATRRASAALDLYDDFVPRKRAKKMAKQLKRMRRTAGKVRDCDLLLARFCADGTPAESPAFLKSIHFRRRDAFSKLCRLHRKQAASGKLKRRMRTVLKKIRARAERRPYLAAQRFKDWAPERLRGFVGDFFQAATPDLRDFTQLHQFRIRSKALRYAMELVRDTFPPEFHTELYPVVERLQTLLGDINDESNFLTSVGTRLANKARLSDVDGLKHRMAHEQHALDEREREFADWWTVERRESLKRRFDQIIWPPAA